MSPAQRSAVATWLRAAADVLLLADWELVVDDEGPEEAAWASVEIVGAHMEGFFRFNAEALRQPPEVVTSVLLHELVHCLHADIRAAVLDALDNADETTTKYVTSTLERHVERFTQQVARILARYHSNLPDITPVIDAEPLQPLHV